MSPPVIRVWLAPTLELAQSLLPAPTITVEAEYGLTVMEGTLYTAAHHQPIGSPYVGRHVDPGGRPAPCNDVGIPLLTEEGSILLSHLDLDSIGGCLRAIPGYGNLFAPVFQPFWDLAEFVDTRGAHKLGQSGSSAVDLRRLRAFWAWSKAWDPLPRDQTTYITPRIGAAGDVLRMIFAGEEVFLRAGDRFRDDEADLNRRTYMAHHDGVVYRTATKPRDFCNHLYETPDGSVGVAVVCYNTATGAVTVSLAEPIPGVSARTIVQALWGPTAGGHDGIAGSPRGVDVGWEGYTRAMKATVYAIREARSKDPG